nr:MAG TPA: hypothetical protein [Caudoviricetes sp.]
MWCKFSANFIANTMEDVIWSLSTICTKFVF